MNRMNKQMKTTLLLLSLLFYFPAFSQDEKSPEQQQEFNNSLGFSAGVNDFHVRDKYLSPYIFAGTMFSSELSYQLKTEQYRHTIDIFYSTGHLDSDIQPRSVVEKIGSLSYSITRTFDVEQVAGNPFEMSLGAGVSLFAANTNFNSVDESSQYTFYDWSWYMSHSLNILFRCEYKFPEHNSFSLQFTMPAIRLVSRPENGHYFNDDNVKVNSNFWNATVQGKPEFIWENLVLFCDAGYKQHLGDNFDIQVNYQFSYISSDRPLLLQTYMNQFTVGLDWLFLSNSVQ
jgi:hypothetical protein